LIYIFKVGLQKSTYVINLHLRGDNKMCLFQWQSESLIIMIIPKKKKRTSQTRLRTCIEKSAQSFIPKANATSLFWNWANADSNVLHRFHISIKVVFCKSLFVLLSFFFWLMYCLSFFDWRLLLVPLVSSNSSWWRYGSDVVHLNLH
jgi:hypothetical protein